MDDVLKKFNVSLNTSDLVLFKSVGKNNIDWLLSKGVPVEVAKKINEEWIKEIENNEYLKYDFLYDYSVFVLESLSKTNDLYLITSRKNEENLFNQIKMLGI